MEVKKIGNYYIGIKKKKYWKYVDASAKYNKRISDYKKGQNV